MKGRVVVAMSGGVDSSVTACLLKEAGYDVFGLLMRTGEHSPPEACDPRPRACCDAANVTSACQVADALGISLHTIDFRDGFAGLVDRFCREYLRGRTPNPCIVCNSELKFGRLWAYARQLGAAHVATGHYARVVKDGDDTALVRGVDVGKDQSYVLFGIERQVLMHVLLPLGDRTKDEVRALAARHALPVVDRPESQEICFVPDDDYAGLIRRRMSAEGRGTTAGEIVDTAGRVLGRHDGFERFTIGQRRGVRIAMGEPYYVVRIEPGAARVVVGPADQLLSDGLVATDVNWLVDVEVGRSYALGVQIRYRHRPAPATVTVGPGRHVAVAFAEPVAAVTPGQAAVFYDGDRVLGGGWIAHSLPEETAR